MVSSRLSNVVGGRGWGSFVAEFIIVVAGIFAGLQADAWYQGLKDREREQVHLQQLARDFEHNIEVMQRAADHHAGIEEELYFAIGVMKRGQVTEEEYERFKWAILTMYQYPPSGVTTGAIDTLIASGDLSLLSDAELKSRLVKFHAIAKLEPSQLEKLGARSSDETGVGLSTFALPHPSGKGIEWHVDFETLIADRQSLGEVANQRRNHGMTRDFYAQAVEGFKMLRDRVAGQLEEIGSG